MRHIDDAASLVCDWYADAARELPWRAAHVGAWPVLVSEVMLQQTPVARVLPAWTAWLQRWPTPAAGAPATARGARRRWGEHRNNPPPRRHSGARATAARLGIRASWSP